MGDYTYRTREDVERWKTRCPIQRLRRQLLEDVARRRCRARRDRRGCRGADRRGPRSSPSRAPGPIPRPPPITSTPSRPASRVEGPRPQHAAARRRARADVHEGDARGPHRGDGEEPADLRDGRGDRQAGRQLRHDHRALRPLRAGAALRHADLRAGVRRPGLRRGDDRHAAGDRLHVRRLRRWTRSARSSTRSPRCST